MSCNITRGRRKTCKNNIAGVSEVYISRYIDYKISDYVGELGAELISVPLRFFYRFELDGTNNSFAESFSYDDNGTSFNVSLNMSLVKLDSETARELNKMQNGKFHIIVKLNNGKYYFLGFQNGLEINKLDVSSGQNKQDFQGYSLGFNGQEETKGMLIWDLESSGIEIINTSLIYVLGNETDVLGNNNNLLANIE